MSDSDEGWRFALEDLPDEDESPDKDESLAEVDDGTETAVETGEDPDGNVAGSLAVDDEIEPGQPTLENAVFVALGVLVTILLFLTMGGVL